MFKFSCTSQHGATIITAGIKQRVNLAVTGYDPILCIFRYLYGREVREPEYHSRVCDARIGLG